MWYNVVMGMVTLSAIETNCQIDGIECAVVTTAFQEWLPQLTRFDFECLVKKYSLTIHASFLKSGDKRWTFSA